MSSLVKKDVSHHTWIQLFSVSLVLQKKESWKSVLGLTKACSVTRASKDEVMSDNSEIVDFDECSVMTALLVGGAVAFVLTIKIIYKDRDHTVLHQVIFRMAPQ